MELYYIISLTLTVIVGIVIPILFRALNKAEERSKANTEIQKELSKDLLRFQRDLDHVKDLIKGIHSALEHRSQIAQLKYNVIKDKIEDLESYLEKMNGYRRRSTSRIDRAKITTSTYPEDDDDVATGIFR